MRPVWLWILPLALAGCSPPTGPGPALDSPEAAAGMVRAYYELLEAGRTSEAAKLRADGKTEDLAPLDTMHAAVGKPGPVEVTLRAVYVETPVVIYGRLSAGGEYLQSGTVLLSRGNAAPWVRGEARMWRIQRITLKP